MGSYGWFHWLSEKVDGLKTLRSITKDAEQLKIIDAMIEDIEKNIDKGE